MRHEIIMRHEAVNYGDLLDYYMSHQFEYDVCIVIYGDLPDPNEIQDINFQDILSNLARIGDFNIFRMPDFSNLNYVKLKIREEECIRLCKLIPNGSPYAAVWSMGKIIYDNT